LLKIQKDESIHSFIYRTHIINGISNFSNILSIEGNWLSFPSLLKGTLQYYQPVDDLKFLNLLRYIGLAKVTDEVFQDPLDYQDDLKRFFGCYKGDNKTRQKPKNIKYCLRCIQEDIVSYGHGMFKVGWWRNPQCNVHQTPLNSIYVSTRGEAIMALKAIYRGENLKNHSVESQVREYFYDPKVYYYNNKIEYIAPCLQNEFKLFIQNKRLMFSKGTSDLLGSLASDKNTSKYYLMQPYVMEKFYNTLKNNNESLFIKFWNIHVKSKIIYTGIITKKSIKEKIFMDKNANCHDCIYHHCGANSSKIDCSSSDLI
jgi:hypothetical protein